MSRIFIRTYPTISNGGRLPGYDEVRLAGLRLRGVSQSDCCRPSHCSIFRPAHWFPLYPEDRRPGSRSTASSIDPGSEGSMEKGGEEQEEIAHAKITTEVIKSL